MSTVITIQGTVISFPTSGESPNWSQPIVDFATAVEGALNSIVGPADVPPQVFIIDSYNPGTNINIPGLTFSTTVVRSALIRYAVYRTTTTATAYESGILNIVYNTNSGVWEVSRQYIGDGQLTFSVTNVGQVQFSTAALAGLNHSGKISFAASALLQS